MACMKTSSATQSRKLTLAILGLLLLIPSSGLSQSTGNISIAGYIPEVFQLEPGQFASLDANINVQVFPASSNSVLIKMKIPKSLRHGTVTVPLVMRTNASHFVLRAKPIVTPADTTASANHVRTLGDGTLLMPGAAEGFNSHNVALQSGSIVASGSRISRRGSGNNPNNALITDLELSFQNLPDGNDDREWSLMVSMERL
jgi:hypothetical protein